MKILHKAYTIKSFIKAAVHIVILATFLSVWKLVTTCLLHTSHERAVGNHQTAANGRILHSPRIPEQIRPPLDWIKRAGIPKYFSSLIVHEQEVVTQQTLYSSDYTWSTELFLTLTSILISHLQQLWDQTRGSHPCWCVWSLTQSSVSLFL